MKILLLEPFYSGSHRQWADGLQRHSSHEIIVWSMPGRHWKWRMHGAAVTFAERWLEEQPDIDLILSTDLVDLATFLGITRPRMPVIQYYHENQLAYPWSKVDQDVDRNWDRRYVWINLTSAMAADAVWFNSDYNRQSFLGELPSFLRAFPDHHSYDIESLWTKSKVMPLGLELSINFEEKSHSVPTILWNHRWEYDKNPELFFYFLDELCKQRIDFKLVVLGSKTRRYPAVFKEAKVKFKEQILQFGPVQSKKEYWHWLNQCTHLPVTNEQDFFGISVVEAIAAGCKPLLPKGLAYEEHLDPDKYAALFYGNQDELLTQAPNWLKSAIPTGLTSEMTKYKWENQIRNYDEALSNYHCS